MTTMLKNQMHYLQHFLVSVLFYYFIFYAANILQTFGKNKNSKVHFSVLSSIFVYGWAEHIQLFFTLLYSFVLLKNGYFRHFFFSALFYSFLFLFATTGRNTGQKISKKIFLIFHFCFLAIF